MSDRYDGENFFTVQDGQRMATPLLLALAVIEVSDVVFAVDSVPAVRFFPPSIATPFPPARLPPPAPPPLMAQSDSDSRQTSSCQYVPKRSCQSILTSGG